MDPDPYAAHDYNPIQQGGNWRGKLRRGSGPIVGGAIALAKWSFVLVKFASIFTQLPVHRRCCRQRGRKLSLGASPS